MNRASDRATTLGELLVRGVRRPFQWRSEKETFQALRDVSFDVHRGEVLGIIGRNGAGKSTLLKILSQITPPTAGEVDIYGRVGALLEVGTGFHPELTGRENIYLNGAILGMSRKEIARQFDSIVDFAETERFLDTPVKRYSTGMCVRLAFAVAAHLRSEILIVDEVLAVGDAAFQRKCMDKMSEVAQHHERTILFVSHNMPAVSSLCTRAILLDRGMVETSGPVSEVVARYLRTKKPDEYAGPAPESVREGAKVTRAVVRSGGGTVGATSSGLNTVGAGETFYLQFTACIRTDEPVELVVAFYDHLRRPLWHFTNTLFNQPLLPRGDAVEVLLEYQMPQLSTPAVLIDFALMTPAVHPAFDLVVDGLSVALRSGEASSRIGQNDQFPLLCEPGYQAHVHAR